DGHTGDHRRVAGVDLARRLFEREALQVDAVDRRQLDRPRGRDGLRDLAAADDAATAVDRFEQVFELRVDLHRCDGDRGDVVVLLETLFEVFLQRDDAPTRRGDTARQWQGDHAV